MKSRIHRKIIVSAIVIPCLIVFAIPITDSVAQMLPEEGGSLGELIDRFCLDIIPRDSGRYVLPSESDLRSVETAFLRLLEWMRTGSEGKLSEAFSTLAAVNYVIIKFTDIEWGRVFYIAREAPGFNRGWGLYALYPKAPGLYRDLLIEVPHIGFDLFTEKIGVKSYLQSYAGLLLVAGAHRNANPEAVADVAHTEACVFHIAHKILCANTSTIIQIHGFAETKAGRELYPQIILSSGAHEGSRAVTEMASALARNGLTVGIFDGVKYTDLGATTNVQGTYARSVGASFIHMEIGLAVRSSNELRGKIARSTEEFAEKFILEVPEFGSPALLLIIATISLMILTTRRRYQKQVTSHQEALTTPRVRYESYR